MRQFTTRSIIIIVLVLIICGGLTTASVRQMVQVASASSLTRLTSSPGPATSPTVSGISATPTFALHNGPVRGISSGDLDGTDGIYWSRISDPSCGWGNLTGERLKQAVLKQHQNGLRVLLLTCQGKGTINRQRLQDIGQARADAVQCGNEQIKYGPGPEDFARFYNACEEATHTVQPTIPVLVGALDPHVGGVDYDPLVEQVNYYNHVETTMNTQIHPGGHWHWRSQILGLIDSWHNGYPNSSVNSLQNLFDFWSQQFGVDSKDLGKHLWVVEGTGCFKGCGLDVENPREIAISHLLTLITDVQTSVRGQVPFFYFSNRDFFTDGVLWPIGVRDINGHVKPLRQDLPMGERTLKLNCNGKQIVVQDQVSFLTSMYDNCTLPDNYLDTLTN